jgi:F0F1-type ATP synthase membrane subunit c/vacuolar-type H+-ATPase subunit K
MVRRRVTDNCIAKRLYEKMTPYIQLGGYLVLLGSIFTGLWIGFNFIKAAQAASADVEALKQFKEETIITLAVQKTTDENIKSQLNRMENIQGKIFERINQIADRRH